MWNRLLGVRAGEGPAVRAALVMAFFAVGMHALANITADTILVATFDLATISHFYVVASVIRIAMTFAYGALAERLRGPRFDTLVIAGAAAMMAASGVLARTGSTAALYGVCVAQLVLPQLAPLVAMSVAMDCFHARQARRLLPLVAAAATLGTIAAGAAARFAAPSLGTASLLFIGAALGAVALPLPARLAALARQADALPIAVTHAPGKGVVSMLAELGKDLQRSSVVRVFLASTLTCALATSLIDFAFKARLKEEYGRDAIAAFMGAMGVFMNLAVLFAQLFLSSRIVGRIGVRASLQAMPAAALAIAPVLAIAPGVASATGAKAAEGLLRYSLVGTVSQLLVTPLDAQARVRASVVAKGAATPVGAMLAGIVLGSFGPGGPPSWLVPALLAATGLAGLWATLGARRAYMGALAAAIGHGRISLDVSPDAAALLRTSLRAMLAERLAEGDAKAARRLLALMRHAPFSVDDVAQALQSNDAGVRRDAISAACSVARSAADARRLLDAVPPGDDADVERNLLACARAHGVVADAARVDRAIDVGRSSDARQPEARLWAEALVLRAASARAPAVNELRIAARASDPIHRAAALNGLGELAEAAAAADILDALGSEDAHVFEEAARAAIAVKAEGAIPILVASLQKTAFARAATQALALAGADAVAALTHALPHSRRAAKALARVGREGCAAILESFPRLDHRLRSAAAHALAAAPSAARSTLPRMSVLGAMDHALADVDAMVASFGAGQRGLLRRELQHRIRESAECALDLASILAGQAQIARARAALERRGRARGNALELLEQSLPSAIAARTLAALELDAGVSRPARVAPAPLTDAWLETCARFDRGELFSDPAMFDVIEKVVVLGETSLFSGLSGEDLYPVGEIAERVALTPGDVVVREGEPGDAVFVVASGTVQVSREGRRLKELVRPAVFGEIALLDGAPRSATVEAITDAELLRIGRAEFEALLDERPEIARGIIRTLLGHLRQ